MERVATEGHPYNCDRDPKHIEALKEGRPVCSLGTDGAKA